MGILEVFEEHRALVERSMQTLVPALEETATRLVDCLRAGHKILVCGNGGSAADAQHFAAELVGRFERDRPALSAVALTTDTSILTSVGNDYGLQQIFVRQVEALARPGDALVAISTSGGSQNIVAAARRARQLPCYTVGLTGETGGLLREEVEHCLCVPASRVARIQEMHELCLHALAQQIELLV